MTSPKKAQANRANALRSTGPRSAAGRAVAAQNARRHGLSVALPKDVVGHKVLEVARLILEDGIDEHAARELAARIVDYERNLTHERESFKPISGTHSTVGDIDPAQEAEKAGMADEWSMLSDELSEPGEHASDIEGLRLYRQVQRFIVTVNRKTARKDALTHARYYRRATNQLIKSLKSIR